MESKLKQFLSKLFGREARTETPAAKAAESAKETAEIGKEPAGAAQESPEVKKEAPVPDTKSAETKPEPAAPNVEVEPEPKLKKQMGDGYYIAYDQKLNGYGGYHDVDMRLYHDGKLIRKITDKRGVFLDFPGVVHGSWEYDVKGQFYQQVNFVTSVYPFDKDGLATFCWMVQPDGRYWADDDGFGMENDVEINLSAKLNKEGRFVTPFSK